MAVSENSSLTDILQTGSISDANAIAGFAGKSFSSSAGAVFCSGSEVWGWHAVKRINHATTTFLIFFVYLNFTKLLKTTFIR